MIPPKIGLSKYVYQIKRRKELPYRVMLVNGTPLDRVSILNTIYTLGQADWDMLAVRLTEEIRRDYISCFDWIRDLVWRTILIIDSVEKLSNSSESFLIDFLDKHGEGSMTVLGGPSESALCSFIRDQGISKQLESAFIIPEVKDEQTYKYNEGSTPSIPVDVFELSAFVVNAFATESIKFNYLKFDLCLLGHLRMREDYPRLIRTDYNCAVIIKVLDDPVTNMSTVSTLTNAASRILINGVSTMKCVRFDPWDSFIFLATPKQFTDDEAYKMTEMFIKGE